MKNEMSIRLRAGLFVLALGTWAAGAAQNASVPAAEWPRVSVRDGITNTIYQPQLESWDKFTLKARSAVAVQAKGEKRPTFGTVDIQAKTRVDRAGRRVYFDAIDVT